MKYYTLSQLSELTGESRKTWANRLDRRRIAFYQASPSGPRRVREDELQRWVLQHTKPATREPG